MFKMSQDFCNEGLILQNITAQRCWFKFKLPLQFDFPNQQSGHIVEIVS